MKLYRFQVLYVDRRRDGELRELQVLAESGPEARSRVEKCEHFAVTDVGPGQLLVDWSKPVFSIPEAAAYFHKSERFVYDLVAQGKLPKPGRDGMMLFTQAQLARAAMVEDAA
jgi:hypothetical protein